MAKRLFTCANQSFVAANAGGSALTNAQYMALKGFTNGIVDVLEILFSGKVGTSTVIALNLKRAGTIETTPTTLAAPNSDGAMHPATAVLTVPAVPFVAAATGPIPSNTVTDATLQLGLNGFGGIVRWNAAPTQQWTIMGATAPGGESVLHNNLLAGGVTCSGDAHILYEPY